jgi:hypothetical protein
VQTFSSRQHLSRPVAQALSLSDGQVSGQTLRGDLNGSVNDRVDGVSFQGWVASVYWGHNGVPSVTKAAKEIAYSVADVGRSAVADRRRPDRLEDDTD